MAANRKTSFNFDEDDEIVMVDSNQFIPVNIDYKIKIKKVFIK